MYEYSGWWVGLGGGITKKERKCAVKAAVSGQSYVRRTHRDCTFVFLLFLREGGGGGGGELMI